MGDNVLDTTVKEKDLGITISADMKVSGQCGIAASKGNQIVGLIRRNVTYKGKKIIIPLYKAIVRPHLEYCIQAWRPYRKKDIDTLERIQRRATKMIPELRDLSYEERLKEDEKKDKKQGQKLIIPLYIAIVRPHFEYCIQAWRPYRKDIDTLERLQRREAEIIPQLRDLSCEERLKECGLTTLERRRLRGDHIEVFKILNGYENMFVHSRKMVELEDGYENMFFHSRKMVELEDMR